MPQAIFRCYEELNDFLPEEKRKRDFAVSFASRHAVGDIVVSLGIPWNIVDLILVDGESVGFERLLQGGERVSVYPVFESFNIRSCRKLGPNPLRKLRFVADPRLEKLAAYLRLFGFDTLCGGDHGVVGISMREDRVLVTTSRCLLQQKGVTRGILVKEVEPESQLKWLFYRLDLHPEACPFTRCPSCNGLVKGESGEAPIGSLSTGPEICEDVLSFCDCCHAVDPFEGMADLVGEVLRYPSSY
jgi:uncharacterized protein with PIN domain